MWRNRRTVQTSVAVAAAAGLTLAACSDRSGITEPTKVVEPTPMAQVTEQFNNEGACLRADVDQFGDEGSPINCTANDVRIANTTVTAVNGDPYDPATDGPIQCAPGDDITLTLTAHLQATSSDTRDDIGVWIATDGGDAKVGPDGGAGACNHYNLLADDPGTTNDDPAFPDDDEGLGDACGGMVAGGQADLDLGTITVPCNVVKQSGQDFLHIGSCLTWKVPGQDDLCPTGYDHNDPLGPYADDAFRSATLPGTPAKCNCEGFNIPVLVVGQLTIVKDVVPGTAADDFGFTTTGGSGLPATFSLDDDGDATLPNSRTFNVVPGNYTVTENDPTPGFDLTGLDCSEGGTEDLANRKATIVMPQGGDITCTFTNTRRATIIIEKQTIPDGASGSFSFSQNVDASGNFSLSDGQTKTFSNVVPNIGSGYTVTESNPTPGFDLTSISCDNPDGQNASSTSLASRAATIKVNPGETVTCVFTNTQRGSVIIEKQTIPDGAAGSFSFTQAVDASGGFSLGDGQTKTFSNVVPTTTGYAVTEGDPTPGFDLTSISCNNLVAGNASTWNVSTRTATVRVDPGETVTCVFTNTQRATVEVPKREGGAVPLTRAWEFQIRSGASLASAGTVIASGTANQGSGVVTFACASGVSASVCGNVGGIAHILPGNYQFCEVNMPAGWANNIDGFTPNGSQPEGADNGDECINISLAAGASGQPSGITIGNVAIDNSPPPGGDARTIGYWKNHSCEAPGNQEDALTPLLGALSPFTTGDANTADDWSITSCQAAVFLLDKRTLSGNHKKVASDPAYNLAAQLVAALLNRAAGAGVCPAAAQAIAAAQLLLDQINFNGTGTYRNTMTSAQISLANSLAGTLDDYNNNELCPAAP